MLDVFDYCESNKTVYLFAYTFKKALKFESVEWNFHLNTLILDQIL